MSDPQPQAWAQTTQPTQPAAPQFNAVGALTQVGGMLGAVLMVILLAAWVVRKLGLAPAARTSQRLKIRASCSVGQRERVVVVEVEGTWLVLGVTAQQITPLHTLPAPADQEPGLPSARAGDFRQRLRQVLSRTGKEQ